jgi:hypothetical protein
MGMHMGKKIECLVLRFNPTDIRQVIENGLVVVVVVGKVDHVLPSLVVDTI